MHREVRFYLWSDFCLVVECFFITLSLGYFSRFADIGGVADI